MRITVIDGAVEQTVVINPHAVECAWERIGGGYALTFVDGTSNSVTEDSYRKVVAWLGSLG